MYCETPVIACNSGGPKESVKNNHTGYLLENDDVKGWAEKMAYLLANPEICQKFGR